MADPPALVFHHDPLYGLGTAARELTGSGLRPVIIDGPGGELPPRDLTGIACIVSLGGSQSALDVAEYPWMRREIDLLSEALESGIPVLGLGLGAHLLAIASGGSVAPLQWHGRHWLEAGWSPVRLVGDSGFWRGLPAELEVFHLHHETVQLTESARIVATSAADPAQAFELPGGHLGVQFMLEADDRAIMSLVEASSEFLVSCGLHPNQVTMDTIRRSNQVQLVASQVFARFFQAAAEQAENASR